MPKDDKHGKRQPDASLTVTQPRKDDLFFIFGAKRISLTQLPHYARIVTFGGNFRQRFPPALPSVVHRDRTSSLMEICVVTPAGRSWLCSSGTLASLACTFEAHSGKQGAVFNENRLNGLK